MNGGLGAGGERNRTFLSSTSVVLFVCTLLDRWEIYCRSTCHIYPAGIGILEVRVEKKSSAFGHQSSAQQVFRGRLETSDRSKNSRLSSVVSLQHSESSAGD